MSESPNDDQISLDLNLPGEFATRFQVIEMIGAGGTGTVFKARDLTLQRWLALKVLSSDKLSEKNIARLQKEAKTICQLKHRNIVDIYDFIVNEKNRPVMVMEYVDGIPLEKIIAENGPLDFRECIEIFLQICSAMNYAHNHGVLHRDLTPSNILVCKNHKGERQIKVVDFGIARVESVHERTIAGFLTIAGSGQLVGTVTVISPEQARGKVTDPRSDIYSLGCLMFKALTGNYPFLGATFIETAQMQINVVAPSLSEKNPEKTYPRDLERIIAKTLQKVPADRFQTMQELEAAIHEHVQSIADPKSTQFRDLIEADAERKFRKSGNLPVIGVIVLAMLMIPVWIYISSISRTKIDDVALEVRSNERHKFLKLNDQVWFIAEGEFGAGSLQALSTSPQVTRVRLMKTKISNSTLAALVNLPIVALDLRRTEIDDSSLKLVSQCKTIRTLLVAGCGKISDEGIKYLSNLTNLIIFMADDTAITDTGLQVICKHDLRLLNVRRTKVTDESVPALLSLKNLDSLGIGGTKISKKGIEELLRKRRMGFIGLGNMDLHDEDIDPKKISLDFSRIDLSNNPITDRIFDRLSKLPNLFFVRMENCPNVSPASMRKFESSKNAKEMIVLPTSGIYGDEFDSEGYFEPTFYDRARGNQKKVKRLLSRWDGEVFERKAEANLFDVTSKKDFGNESPDQKRKHH